MSLRSKIILALSLVAVLWAIADNVLLRTLVSTHFNELEGRTADDAVVRANADVTEDIQDLRQLATSLAVYAPLRDGVRAGDRSRVAQLMDDDSLESAGLDLLVLVDEEGRVLHYFGRDEDGAAVTYRMFPSQAIAPTNPLLKQSEGKRQEQEFGSILNSEHGFLAVCAVAVPLAEVLPDDLFQVTPVFGWHEEDPDEGPAGLYGSLIAGRLVEGDVMREYYGHVARVRIVDTIRQQLTPTQEEGVALLQTDARSVVNVVDAESGGLSAFRLLDDAEGKPTMLLQVDIDPDALIRGDRVRQFLALSTLGTSALIFLVLLRLLQKAVINPLTRLTKHAIEVGQTDDTSRRIDLDRDDEIGQLSDEFNRMLDKLEDSRRLIVQSARQAGMSEVATGVLHNVGNVLNSVNVSRSLMERKLEDLAVRDFARTVDVLKAQGDDLGRFIAEDPRGKSLLPFLEELSQAFTTQHTEILQESENLRKSVDHIADLVRSQQAYAGSRGVFERTSLEGEVENALKISVQAYGDDLDLEVVRDFEDVPLVSVDRHKLMEILINLIQNAKQAMRSAGAHQPRLAIAIRCPDAEHVSISISDNGEGIPEENLARIFGHGFTTKQDGHGFGLHVSANAATEMGGELRAHSDGLGTGATFTVVFPIEFKSSTEPTDLVEAA